MERVVQSDSTRETLPSALAYITKFSKYFVFYKQVGAAWLSSVHVVTSGVESPNERSPRIKLVSVFKVSLKISQ